MKNSKKVITTKDEKELARLINFSGKYVESLIKSAQSWPFLKGRDVKTLLRERRARIKAAKKARAAEFGLSVKKCNALMKKAKLILGSFHTGHSMGCYRELWLKRRSGRLFFAANSELDTYAKSCTWRPTYGSIVIELSTSELQRIQNIEGVWTIVNPDGGAKWLESTGRKNTYSVKWIEGFVYGTTHSTVSLEAARAGEIKKMQAVINAVQDDNRFIGAQHIKATGACEAGIRAYCNRHGLNPEFGYNLGYLKALESSIYFEKIQK